MDILETLTADEVETARMITRDETRSVCERDDCHQILRYHNKAIFYGDHAVRGLKRIRGEI